MLAQEQIAVAVAPDAVAVYRRSLAAAENLALLRKTASYQQGSFVDKGGWSTLPGGEVSNYALSQACATALADAK